MNFILKDKKLVISHKNLSLVEEYEIGYPRYTTKGNKDDENFFNFYFIVKHREKLGVIIIRAVNITNLPEVSRSDNNIKIENREDYISEEEIIRWQEYIYRSFGLGNGVKKLELDDEQVENLNITKSEYAYAINEIYLQAEKVYIADRCEYLKLEREKSIDIFHGNYSLDELENLGFEGFDFKAVENIKEEINLNLDRKNRLEEGRSKHQVSLPEILERITRDILKQEKPVFIESGNMVKVLRENNLSIQDIDIKAMTHKLLYRVLKTKLTVVEMLEMIINYNRRLDEALHIVEVRKNLKKEKDLAAL